MSDWCHDKLDKFTEPSTITGCKAKCLIWADDTREEKLLSTPVTFRANTISTHAQHHLEQIDTRESKKRNKEKTYSNLIFIKNLIIKVERIEYKIKAYILVGQTAGEIARPRNFYEWT